MNVALNMFSIGWIENEESLRSRVLMAQSVKNQKVEYGKKINENYLFLSKETTLYFPRLSTF